MECNNFDCVNVEDGRCLKYNLLGCISEGCNKYKSCECCNNKDEKSILVCEYCRNF
jgi:hypothetical protein